MDFVGYDDGAVSVADICYFCEFVFSPYPSSWVVRVAEDEHLATFDVLFKTGEIYFVLSVIKLECVSHNLSAVVFRNEKERMVDRLHYHDLVALFGQSL
jgi:hypothetical protein